MGRELGEEGAGDEDQAGLGGDELGEGKRVEGVDVSGRVGGEGLEGDLLDGAVGVEEDGGNGVEGTGAEIEEGAGGVSDEGGGVAEDFFEESGFFAVVGGDLAVGEGGGVESATGMGGGEGGDDPEGGEGGGEFEVYCGGANGWVGFEVRVEVVGQPDGDQGGERGVGGGHVVGQAGLDAAEEE